jgi:hypothetical protein
MQNSRSLQLAARRRQLGALIDTAGARFVRIDFVKKDGSIRRMTVAPKARTGLVGDAASDGAKAGVAKRKVNHPNLKAVYDVHAEGWRSINLDTGYAVKVDGTRYEVLDGLADQALAAARADVAAAQVAA